MKKCFLLVLVLLSLITLLSAGGAPAEHAVMQVCGINGGRVNVRESADGDILCRVDSGTHVEAEFSVSVPNGWTYVTVSGQDLSGYVRTWTLDRVDCAKDEECLTWEDSAFDTPRLVSARALNQKTGRCGCLHASPSKASQAIRRLHAGDMLQVIDEDGSWSRVIDLLTGRCGYVSNTCLDL